MIKLNHFFSLLILCAFSLSSYAGVLIITLVIVLKTRYQKNIYLIMAKSEYSNYSDPDYISRSMQTTIHD